VTRAGGALAARPLPTAAFFSAAAWLNAKHRANGAAGLAERHWRCVRGGERDGRHLAWRGGERRGERILRARATIPDTRGLRACLPALYRHTISSYAALHAVLFFYSPAAGIELITINSHRCMCTVSAAVLLRGRLYARNGRRVWRACQRAAGGGTLGFACS